MTVIPDPTAPYGSDAEYAWRLDEILADIRNDIWKANDKRGWYGYGYDGSDAHYFDLMATLRADLARFTGLRRGLGL